MSTGRTATVGGRDGSSLAVATLPRLSTTTREGVRCGALSILSAKDRDWPGWGDMTTECSPLSRLARRTCSLRSLSSSWAMWFSISKA